MPVTPPDVSTSQIRMSRVAPSAWPLSQRSSAQGRRSIVTLMSRMVMSEMADIIGRFPCWPDHVGLIADRESQSHNAGADPAPSVMPPMRGLRLSSGVFGKLEHQAGGGGMRQQAAFGVGNARLG